MTTHYPPLDRGPDVEDLHGRLVPDPYRALEGPDPAAADWLAAQQALARRRLDATPHRTWFERTVRELSELPGRGLPAARGNRLFHTEQAPGVANPTLVVQEPAGPRQLVDPAHWGSAAGARITAWNAAGDGSLLAFQICDDGIDDGPLRVLDVATGTLLTEVADDLRAPSVAWGGPADRRPTGIFYPRTGGDGPPAGLYFLDFTTGDRTAAWTPGAAGTPVFAVPAVSPDGRWLLTTVRHGADPRTELLIADLESAPLGEPMHRQLVAPGVAFTAARFGGDGRIYAFTQLGAARGRICVFDPAAPDPDDWRELTAAGPGATIRAFAPMHDRVAVCRLADGRTEVAVIQPDSGAETLLALPGDGTVSAMTGSPGADNRLWIGHAEPGRPATVLQFAPADGATPGYWFRPAPPERDRGIRADRTSCRSADGTEVPISLLTAEPVPEGPRPVLLSVYGGFGISAERTFNAETYAWLLAGGTHAVAHVRGGGELGAGWHEAGRGRNKPRSVDDLIAVAEHLIATGVTGPEQLVVFGASNGGLLAAAAAVRRPDLFRGCVCVHPVTDLLRYPLLGDGRAWLAEYGDRADPLDAAALLSYSPYHNVRTGVRYPAFLLMAGTADRRVPPVHARKLCAALQHATGADPASAPVLLREQRHAGHGVIPRDQVLGWLADRLAFTTDLVGLRPAGPDRDDC
ncbi:prolyl oligopeptidase family serine peptidase [Kitasatospora sp. HPMI-4]|uniref:prolyl oligopeptidase family serine peptidase n=1 Tax=Kitasatospora sp. HPMI-4 TaxID=3448443 RepID=UPI003F1E14CA